MKFNIPSVGDRIQLTRAWEFPLIAEHRQRLLDRIDPSVNVWNRPREVLLATLEKGTTLRIDRIYIRKGKSEWDSITFVITDAPNDKNRNKAGKYKGARFWAKLEDVNEMFFKPIEK